MQFEGLLPFPLPPFDVSGKFNRADARLAQPDLLERLQSAFVILQPAVTIETEGKLRFACLRFEPERNVERFLGRGEMMRGAIVVAVDVGLHGGAIGPGDGEVRIQLGGAFEIEDSVLAFLRRGLERIPERQPAQISLVGFRVFGRLGRNRFFLRAGEPGLE